MNRTKIDWCDYTWNPITGCRNGCFYCYARLIYKRFGRSFTPNFHPERLPEPTRLSKPSRIFCGSVCDMWSVGVQEKWRLAVYEWMEHSPQHEFYILTKRIERVDPFMIPKNCFLGVSLSYGNEWSQVNCLRLVNKKTFVSVEPYLWGIPSKDDFCPDWVIIGAMTGPHANDNKPNRTDLIGLVEWVTKRDKPLFMKKNLRSSWKGNLIQQFPKS